MGSGTILVTGAAGAFGSFLVTDLLRRGRRVVAHGRSEGPVRSAIERAAELTGATWGTDALRVAGFELSDGEAWDRLLPTLEEGPLEGAVLAAGGWIGGVPFTETSDDVWSAMLSKNLDSARLALARILPLLVAQRSGSVVLVGSRAAVRPWDSVGAAAYASAKAAVVALTQTVAAEVLTSGVRVNVVLPSTLGEVGADESSSQLLPPASLAAVVRFLLSPDAKDVSGAALPVYGQC